MFSILVYCNNTVQYDIDLSAYLESLYGAKYVSEVSILGAIIREYTNACAA